MNSDAFDEYDLDYQVQARPPRKALPKRFAGASPAVPRPRAQRSAAIRYGGMHRRRDKRSGL